MSQTADDLNSLIHQAQNDISARKPPAPPEIPDAPNRLPLALLLLATAVFIWGWHFWSDRITEDQISGDAHVLLLRAKEMVDRDLTERGRLPAVLPDAMLAGIVHYEILSADAKAPVYQLSVDINGRHDSLRSE